MSLKFKYYFYQVLFQLSNKLWLKWIANSGENVMYAIYYNPEDLLIVGIETDCA